MDVTRGCSKCCSPIARDVAIEIMSSLNRVWVVSSGIVERLQKGKRQPCKAEM